jgi:hypothetical protein
VVVVELVKVMKLFQLNKVETEAQVEEEHIIRRVHLMVKQEHQVDNL